MHGAGPSCVAEEAHGIKPDQEADDGDPGVPDEFGYYVGKNESSPVVCTAFALPVQESALVKGCQDVIMLRCVPCFVKFSLYYKYRDDL